MEMTLGRIVAILLLALPIIEIALIIKVGQTVGLLWTLALLIGAGVLGGFLLRQQGLSVLADLQSTMGRGRLPGRALADTLLIGLAAVLLVVPGFLTDILAILLLIPSLRTALYALLARNMVVVSTGTAQAGAYGRRDEPLIELDDDEYRPRRD